MLDPNLTKPEYDNPVQGPTVRIGYARPEEQMIVLHIESGPVTVEQKVPRMALQAALDLPWPPEDKGEEEPS